MEFGFGVQGFRVVQHGKVVSVAVGGPEISGGSEPKPEKVRIK